MNKKTKVLIVIGASIATSLTFLVPWFSMHMEYEEYSRIEEENYKKKYGDDFSSVSEEQLAEAGEVATKNLAMITCLNRFRKEKVSFITALNDCNWKINNPTSRP